MNIKLAKYAGFCMGVRRAITLCMNTLKQNKKPLYSFGPIIHNNVVIQELSNHGVKIIEKVDDLKSGDYVIIRSHGISPVLRKELKEKGVIIFDATCPKVARVQSIIKKNVADGLFVVIIGDKGHAETKALISYAEGSGIVISNEEELRDFIKKDIDKQICVVAQTTQEIELFEKFCKILKNKFPNLIIVNTICDATRRRQFEVVEKAGKSDLVFVVGGKHSANTTRLYEISKNLCDKTYHIEKTEEVDLNKINKKDRVFITAGASTPLWAMYDVASKVKEKVFLGKIKSLLGSKTFLVFSFIFSSVISFLIKGSAFYIFSLFFGLFLTSSSLSLYNLKNLDIFKFNSSSSLLRFVLGIILLIFLTLFYNIGILFLVFYFLFVFYLISKNLISKRQIKFFFVISYYLAILIA